MVLSVAVADICGRRWVAMIFSVTVTERRPALFLIMVLSVTVADGSSSLVLIMVWSVTVAYGCSSRFLVMTGSVTVAIFGCFLVGCVLIITVIFNRRLNIKLLSIAIVYGRRKCVNFRLIFCFLLGACINSCVFLFYSCFIVIQVVTACGWGSVFPVITSIGVAFGSGGLLWFLVIAMTDGGRL